MSRRDVYRAVRNPITPRVVGRAEDARDRGYTGYAVIDAGRIVTRFDLRSVPWPATPSVTDGADHPA